jgi:hypothetical protein
MIDWWEVLQNPMIEQLGDCSFYINSSRLFEQGTLSKNTYYIHYVRRMKPGRKFWCTWKDSSQSMLIIQVFYAIEFGKIFKDPKMQTYANDKFWLNTIQIKNDDVLTEGFYTFYHTRELKGGLLNIAGTMIIQVKCKKDELFIPIDEDTKIGEIHNLISKYIDLYPNKFIITGADKKDNLYLISFDDYVMKLMKNGIEFFDVQNTNMMLIF